MPWIVAGGAVLGSVLGGMGSSSAAKKQQRAAEAATAAQRDALTRQEQLQEPFRDAGVMANNKLLSLLGLRSEADSAAMSQAFDRIYREERNIADQAHRAQYGFGFDDAPSWAKSDLQTWDQQIRDEAKKRAQTAVGSGTGGAGDSEFGSLMRDFSMADFEADPGYQFRMDEGMRGVEGGAAARGGLLSGAALKAIQKYGQGLASQEYGNAYNRYTTNQTNKYNKLAGLVSSGQGATNQLTNANAQFGQQQANNLIGAGNAQASGIMGMTNALVGGMNQGINAYQQNQLMNLIRQPSSSGWGGSAGRWGNGTVDALGDGVWG
ncbi:hypothetical protein [Hydrogenophaga crocea]|uniref:DNA transfer protein n=1 Tax=Hydrogenophaga crocea TaxID=2716225 RepID=A0A6G8IF22_9BURK|nr:hypothetical protein [Hydrogenophaga crocea]QIM51626.1 hypothetical protein G9Q37_05470 [Hydrogenophaga crocea]